MGITYDKDTKIDSREGITWLIEWARAGGFVLSERHRRIAKKYGVSTDGVMFAAELPKMR